MMDKLMALQSKNKPPKITVRKKKKKKKPLKVDIFALQSLILSST